MFAYMKSIDSYDASRTKASSTCSCVGGYIRRLLEGGLSIGCCSGRRLRDCTSSSPCLIISPSDGKDSKSDDIWDEDSDSEMTIGVVARSPATASATVALEILAIYSWRATCSRFMFPKPNALPLSLPLEQPCIRRVVI